MVSDIEFIYKSCDSPLTPLPVAVVAVWNVIWFAKLPFMEAYLTQTIR